MTTDKGTLQMLTELRAIYAADPPRASERIEAHLRSGLAHLSEESAQAILAKIIEGLHPFPPEGRESMDSAWVARVFSQLLGRKVEPEDLSSTALLERLAQSLNTIFNALNELISVINMTFNGRSDIGDQTIRQFIGFHLEGGDQTESLEKYLGRIKHAFLITQKAFQQAAQTKVEQILRAVDPEALAADRKGGLKLGPLRKAEDFDILKERIERIRRWYEKGQFMEDFLREFEKNCQASGET